jgi:hypothetical protein
MLRDLMFPQDAQKELAALVTGLGYDAALAVAGKRLSEIPPENDQPDFCVPVRASGASEDQAVRRDAPVLFSRFAIISMVSRFETYLNHLLLQRRVLEFLGTTPGRKMDGPNFWRILIAVQQASKAGPVSLCHAVATNHSSELQVRMEWLDGLYRVRNCLAHRLGIVQMVDVKPPGVSLDKTKAEDRLRAKWLRVQLRRNGEEITLPHTFHAESNVQISFEEYVREWKIGDQIDVQPEECQYIAFSMSYLARQIETEFEREMTEGLGLGGK